jgi:hypothetical protein
MKTIHKINTLLIFLLVMLILLSMAPRPKGQSNSADTAVIVQDGGVLRLRETFEVEIIPGTFIDTDSGEIFIPSVPVITMDSVTKK